MKSKKFTPVLYHIIKLGLFFVAAIIIFIFRHQIVVNHLRISIGILMLVYGIDEILFEVLFHGLHFYKKSKTYLGFVEILFSFALLFGSIQFEYVCIIWATWSIIRESYEVKEILTEIDYLVPKIISGVESIAVIVLSIMLILNPTEHHAMIHVYLLLLELPLNPLVPLIDASIHYYKTNKDKTEETKSE